MVGTAMAARYLVILRSLAIGIAGCLAAPVTADAPLSVHAWPDLERSEIVDFGADLQITLTLTEPVPWRVFTLTDPARLIIDFSTVDWSEADLTGIVFSDRVTRIAAPGGPAGWSRLSMWLDAPMLLETAGLRRPDGGGAEIKMQLIPTDEDTFTETSGMEPAAQAAAELVEDDLADRGEFPLTVILDPAHGGIDTGAVEGERIEANVVLEFAKDLAAALEDNGMRAILTRQSDIFVPLEARLAVARRSGADVFVSLHADFDATGQEGLAKVYALASKAESGGLASTKHDRAAPGDGRGSVIAKAPVKMVQNEGVSSPLLIDLANGPDMKRGDALADRIAAVLDDVTGQPARAAQLQPGYELPHSPDVPAALVDLGQSAENAELRGDLISAMVTALGDWAETDHAE